MSNTLHVCLYNTEPEASRELQTAISGLNFVRFVGEVTTPDELANAIHNAGVNLVFFHLDPVPDAVVEVIEHAATRYSDLALIAISHKSDVNAVIGPMRAGCDQFVCEPIDHADLANAVARVASRRLSRNTKSRCICVIGPSGGSGSTSIACNLALEIGHLTDRECGLIDLDLQFGDAAANFDVIPKYSIYDLADAGAHVDRSVLASTVTALPCKVALVARPALIEQDEAITPEIVHRVVELCTTAYENVVVDLPGHLDSRTTAALSQADVILIVCQLLVPSVRNASRLGEALAKFGIPDERVQYVVNRAEGKSGRISVEDVEEAVKKPVFATIPNDYQFMAKSIDFGRPAAAMDANNHVRTAIRKIATQIIANDGGQGPSAQPDARRGFLSRLLSK